MQAYQWLRTQPDGVREMAGSPDALVSLYLKAKRSGESFSEGLAPQSKENFKNDLRNLASELKAFNNGVAPANHLEPEPPIPPRENLNFTEPKPPRKENQDHRSPLNYLDMKSYEMIVEIRNRLNLSSDTEVLRMLITIGYDRIKDILPHR